MSTLSLASVAPFNQLAADQLRVLQPQLQLRRCRIGQVLQAHEQVGQGVAVVLRGQLRSLAVDPLQAGLRTVARIGPVGVSSSTTSGSRRVMSDGEV